MKDVADQLGLSATTVSHVLNGHAEQFRISPQTVARVRALAAQIGYRSSALARSLRTNQSFAVGLVVEDLGNPFWTGLALGVEREAEIHGYVLVVVNTNGELERERRALTLLREGRLDGLILPPFARSGADLRAVRKEGHAFVQVDRALDGLDAPCVRTDHEAGSKLALDHLARRGHRRIAVAVGPPDVQPHRQRLDGFRHAGRARGLASPHVLRVSTPDAATAEAVVSSFLRDERRRAETLRKSPVTALYATNIWLTIGALRAVRAVGLSVPGDLDLVGFDEIPLADLLRHPVTTVVQDVEEIGRTALRLLLDVKAGKHVPAQTLVAPALATAAKLAANLKPANSI